MKEVEPSATGAIGGLAHWVEDFLKPVNVVSLTIALFSLLLSMYFYRQTINDPEISWTSQSQIVFDYHSANSAITVLDSNGKKIIENMYATQFIIWNSGNIRLDNVDAATIIRQPLTIDLKGQGHIVTASIISSRNDTDGLWNLGFDQNKIVFSWRHFDPNAAARILILYTGNRESRAEPSISIAGYSALKGVKYSEPRKGMLKLYVLPILLSIFAGFTLLGLTVSFGTDLMRRRAAKKGVSAREPNSQFMIGLWILASIISYLVIEGFGDTPFPDF